MKVRKFESIEAQEIILVDGNGTLLARLGAVLDEGEMALMFHGLDGELRMSIGTSLRGNPVIRLVRKGCGELEISLEDKDFLKGPAINLKAPNKENGGGILMVAGMAMGKDIGGEIATTGPDGINNFKSSETVELNLLKEAFKAHLEECHDIK